MKKDDHYFNGEIFADCLLIILSLLNVFIDSFGI